MTSYRVAKITAGDQSVICIRTDRNLLKENKVDTLLQKFYQDENVAGVYFCFPFHGDVMTSLNPKSKKPWTVAIDPFNQKYGDLQMI